MFEYLLRMDKNTKSNKIKTISGLLYLLKTINAEDLNWSVP